MFSKHPKERTVNFPFGQPMNVPGTSQKEVQIFFYKNRISVADYMVKNPQYFTKYRVYITFMFDKIHFL